MHTLNKPAMKRQSSMGINARLLLMTLLPTGLMALVMGGYFSWQQLRYTEEQLLQRGLMTMEYLQQPAATALLNGDTGQIGSILYNALNYTDVRALTLYDTEMVALEHRGRGCTRRANPCLTSAWPPAPACRSSAAATAVVS